MGDGVIGTWTEAADGCLASAGSVREVIVCVVGKDPFEQLNGESGVRVTSCEFMEKGDEFPYIKQRKIQRKRDLFGWMFEGRRQ